MKISEMNWHQVAEYLKHDNRAVVPLGCTEQHAYLSLSTDSILAERVAEEAAAPLGIPVFPVVGYGITPAFRAFPGTISLRVETFLRVVRDILDGLKGHGFRRILIVNGHGGNTPARGLVAEWMADNPGCQVKFHSWYCAPKTWAKTVEIDPLATHADWMENFPWTRLPSVAMPQVQKPMADEARLDRLGPQAVREALGDGSYGGYYQRSDEEMLAMWRVAVEETRQLLESGWE